MHFTLDRSLIGALNGILTLRETAETVETDRRGQPLSSRNDQIFCDIKSWSCLSLTDAATRFGPKPEFDCR